MNLRVLFCNIAYMQFYDNRIYDNPVNGGAYVQKHNDAYEKFNFQECEDGYYRGFVETKHNKGYEEGNKTNTFNQIHIERIDPNYKNSDYIDDVLVVFCAKPKNGSTVIVGWYKNAKVYRHRPDYNGRIFNLEARVQDSTLLAEEDRKFVFPRAKKGIFGFGQSNVRYPNYEEHGDFIRDVIRYIYEDEHVSFNIQDIVEEHQEYVENGSGKRVYINTYERNPKARKECIKIHGSKCAICGFDAKEIYGEEYEGKIHVHHIIPIHEVGIEYRVNPATDLIPVCPNCHMILHTKINGIEPKLEDLKLKFSK